MILDEDRLTSARRAADLAERELELAALKMRTANSIASAIRALPSITPAEAQIIINALSSVVAKVDDGACMWLDTASDALGVA